MLCAPGLPGFDVPLYLTPPSTESIRRQIQAGLLGMIATPAQGNRIPDGAWWAADNGVFGGSYPGDAEYLAWLSRLRRFAPRCLFATAPDVVANHWATVNRSFDMLQRIRDLGFPVAFVAQDFMETCAWDLWDDIDCLFIGGSTRWKLSAEAASLARCARSVGKHVHMGRVNSFKRFRYAADEVEAHSVDGTFLTYAPDRLLASVLGWRVRTRQQMSLFDSILHVSGR